MKKIFVLDTNVLINKPDCIFDFEENDIVIPDDVLEELDKFKSEYESERGFKAREFLRVLWGQVELTGEKLTKGISLGDGKGTIRMVHTPKKQNAFPNGFSVTHSVDNRIIYLCKQLSRRVVKTPIVLLSTDTNICIKANSEGVTSKKFIFDAQVSKTKSNYSKDKIIDLKSETTYSGRSKIVVSIDVYLRFKAGGKIVFEEIEEYKRTLSSNLSGFKTKDFFPNEFIEVYDITDLNELREFQNPVLGRYDVMKNEIQQLKYFNQFKMSQKKSSDINIKTKNIGQKFVLEAMFAPSNIAPLVIIKGAAGTAKTFLSAAAGVDGVLKNRYDRIIVTRPNVEMDKDIGFIPGKEDEKMEPYMRSLKDNLELLLPFPQYPEATIMEQIGGKRGRYEPKKISYVEKLFYDEKIKPEALSFLRGRSLTKTLLIVDEAQNCTPLQAKTIATRGGEGTKIVLLGDPNQIDREGYTAETNGLTYLFELMKDSELCWQVTLNDNEGTRSALAIEVERLAKEKEHAETSVPTKK